jgi:cytochrome c553
VGPDLQGLHERRTEAWIIEFVRNPQKVIASGDPTATALLEEYQGFVMPEQPLSPDEVRQVLAYIRRTESFGPAPVAAGAAATEEQVQLGQELFQGTTRLANAGPTCTSCHDVQNDSITGGGALARELTTAFSRLGSAGIQGIIRAPPFPVMQRAYQDKPLTEEEVVALAGFLQRADEQRALQQPRTFTLRLLLAGAGGTVLLLGLYSLAWRRRLRGSVNQSIYDRQITST